MKACVTIPANHPARKELVRLRNENERYRESLRYARYQSHWNNQIRGIEVETYLAWIHEHTSKALRLPQLRR